MLESIDVQPYDVARSAEIRRFCLDMVEKEYSYGYDQSWAYDIDSLDDPNGMYNAHRGGAFFVAISQGMIVGTAGVRGLNTSSDLAGQFSWHYSNPEEVALLGRVYVRKDIRRKKVGSRLVSAAVSSACRFGYAMAYLNASTIPNAVDFWKKQGFQEFFRENDSFGTVHMEYELL